MSTRIWRCCQYTLEIAARPLVMGILNVTPDSFSDGGKFTTLERACEQAQQLLEAGADLLDIGGESTRPGSQPVAEDEELRRVLPVITALAKSTAIPISIDTSKSTVAKQALAAGATIINDVTGLRDPAMRRVAKETGAGVVAMHMQGTPATMQLNPQYEDVVREVRDYLRSAAQELLDFGLLRETIALDPGIGFGKSIDHNLELLAQLHATRPNEFADRPLCLGVSRKGFISKVCGRSGSADPIPNRVAGSLAIACFGMPNSVANILRVHDVRETADAVKIHAALERFRTPERTGTNQS
jgi:dihydropteroate synthase